MSPVLIFLLQTVTTIHGPDGRPVVVDGNLSTSAPAIAATAASAIKIGGLVSTSDGVVVGHVVAADGENVIVDATTTRLPLPRSMFTVTPVGASLAMTKPALDAAIVERERVVAASRDHLMKVGTAVVGADGESIGVVSGVESGVLVVDLGSSGLVRIPFHSFIGTGNVLAMAQTRSQLLAMIAPHR